MKYTKFIRFLKDYFLLRIGLVVRALLFLLSKINLLIQKICGGEFVECLVVRPKLKRYGLAFMAQSPLGRLATVKIGRRFLAEGEIQVVKISKDQGKTNRRIIFFDGCCLDLETLNNRLRRLCDHKVRLVVYGCDTTFPVQEDHRAPKRNEVQVKKLFELIEQNSIEKVFVENLDTYHKKIFPLPSGFSQSSITGGWRFVKTSLNYKKLPKACLLQREDGREGSQWEERKKVKEIALTNWSEFVDYFPEGDLSYFRETVKKYRFILCVHGGGYNVEPKAFEALLYGCIPVMANSSVSSIYHQHQLPAIVVDEWCKDALSHDFLDEQWGLWRKYVSERGGWRSFVIRKLTAQYWVNFVRG